MQSFPIHTFSFFSFGFVADIAAVHSNGIKMFLASGISKFFMNGARKLSNPLS